MFGEEGFYYDLARKLLDAYSLDQVLEIAEADPVDILAELLMSQQLLLNLEDFEDVDYEDD